ncbi:MAG: RNA polymerase subunit sigma-70 [Ignavibacteria bacterium GWA2_35_9]|nr:MAG: RNA polymerase subunit sigma-70 [Ignavibacteria bacterium GWA2_35_9]OGU45631.1 MAG: RNA polymerase subunit sigma-70 [Ignavibacteria bacterium GWB2_36_8]OGU51920.1 MAG: RNA polymerase subunit sigma-70 [Ignavibacteria bacterium GWC2_36_12]OGV01108.1 MAG: RNA polymerase subunit sigma-70 [Ignavibacteria bacterium RIFOXYB2_FULL_36_7]
MSLKRKKKVLQPSPRILEIDDDFSLIKRFIEGDETTFRTLVYRHKEKVRNIVYLTMNYSDSVDDIAQEVFITVYKNLKYFRFESQFTTWLYRITINKCRDHLRKLKIRNIFTPVKDIEEVHGYNHINENMDIPDIVRKAISKLPEKLRIPLLLKDIEGFSYQEIADTVQCEIGTVKSRIFRARESLRNILKPYEGEL